MPTENVPQNIIGKLVKTGKEFRYPKSVGEVDSYHHHFMIIRELEYDEENKQDDVLNGQNVFERISGAVDSGFYKEKRNFCLFLPQGGLTTQYSANYESVDLGFFGQVVENNIGEITNNISQYFDQYQNDTQNFLNKTMDFYTKIGSDIMPDNPGESITNFAKNNNVINQLKFNVTSAVGGLATIGSDKVKGEDVAALSMRAQRNPYTSLVFVGNKTKRTHSFKFQFNPKNSPESEEVMKIIHNLKHGMLPSLPPISARNNTFTQVQRNPKFDEMNPADRMYYGTPKFIPKKDYSTKSTMPSLMFKNPNVYNITFYDTTGDGHNKHLFKIGNSVLTSLKSDFSETFFDKTGLPTTIDLTLQFKENFTLSQSHIDRGY